MSRVKYVNNFWITFIQHFIQKTLWSWVLWKALWWVQRWWGRDFCPQKVYVVTMEAGTYTTSSKTRHHVLKVIREKQITDGKTIQDVADAIIQPDSWTQAFNTTVSWFILCIGLTPIISLTSQSKDPAFYIGEFLGRHFGGVLLYYVKARKREHWKASKKRGRLKWAWKGRGFSGGKEGKTFQTKGRITTKARGRKCDSRFEPLAIRKSCAPGKRDGYGRETNGRLTKAG